RTIQYAAASRFNHCRLWNTGSPAGACHRARIRATRWRVTTTEYEAAISRRWSPEVCIVVCPPRNWRAQGRPGACCTRGLACDLRKQKCTRAYRAAGAFRPSLRNGFTAYSELSPVNGSFATVVAQKKNPPQLDASTAASGPHDFAVRIGRERLARLSRPSHLTARS